MKLITSLFVAIILMQALPSAAEQSPYAIDAKLTEFIVSGVLRSNADGMVIKLVQGVKKSVSSDEAVGAFSRDVLARYPGYSIIDALASPIAARKPQCGQSI